MLSRVSKTIRIIWKYTRKPLLGLAAVLGIVLISAWLLAAFFEDEVKAYFLQKINAELNTRVEIGEIHLSLLDHFPQASVSLQNVKADHSKPYRGAGKLLEAQSIDFSFSVWDLFSGSYSIHRIDLSNGAMNILRNSDGIINYQLLKPQEKSISSDEKFSFELKSLHVNQMNILIRDEPSSFSTLFLVNSGQFKGAFTDDVFDLDIDTDVQLTHLKSDETTWLSDRPVSIDVGLKINKSTDLYTFTGGDIQISDLQLTVDGSIQNQIDPVFDLKLGGKDLDISSFLSVLPAGYDEQIKKYRSDGKFYCSAELKGVWGKKTYPLITASFGISEGEITQKENDIQLEGVNLIGTFTNGSQHNMTSSELSLKQVRMKLRGGDVKGDLLIRNFSQPYIQVKADASLALSDIQQFFPLDPLQLKSGTARLNLQLRGPLAGRFSPGDPDHEELHANGLLQISDASFRIAGDSLSYTGFSGNFSFNNNDVSVDNFRGLAGRTDFMMKGNLGNVFGYLFTKDQPIRIETTVQSKHVYLDELFGRHAASTPTPADNAGAYSFRISPRLNLKVNARVDQLQFRKFRASSIVGDFRVANRELVAERLLLKTMGGALSMSGSVDGTQEKHLLLSCTAKLSKVDINRVFVECENFGQDVMMDKNIRGKLDADVSLTSLVSPGLEIDLNKLYCRSDIVITQGELIEFTPLNNLSRFISLDELKHVKFSTLKNQIEIRDRKIIIPKMDIASSAITIGASGVHGFDNQVDYHFEILLSDLLSRKAKKAKKENEEFGIIEDDGLGKTHLFISMKGPVDKPVIAYDSKGAQQKIRQDLQTEKKTMKQVLHEEFGWYKKDTSVVKKEAVVPDKKKKKVIIEFDD